MRWIQAEAIFHFFISLIKFIPITEEKMDITRRGGEGFQSFQTIKMCKEADIEYFNVRFITHFPTEL